MKQTKANAIATTATVNKFEANANEARQTKATKHATESAAYGYKDARRAAVLNADSELRGFNANVKAWRTSLANCADTKAIFAQDNLQIDFFTVDYLKANLPLRFNANGVICAIKKDVAATEGIAGVEIVERNGIKVALVPQSKWTANQFYTMFKAARKNELASQVAAKKAAEKAAATAAKLEREREKYEALKAKFEAGKQV